MKPASITNSGETNLIERIRVVLVETSHPGNVGATARAMMTMGLSQLCLVSPRCKVDAEAVARASGAVGILDNAHRCETLDEALVGCRLVMGTTARSRTLDWPVLEPRAATEQLVGEAHAGDVALVFGTERTGLSNEQLDRCHSRVTIPANPEYSSLNLAAAVQVLCYEIRCAALGDATQPVDEESAPASADEMERFYAHLENVLVASDFLDPDNPRHLMRRLRRLFNRARPDQNEMNILRGILTAVMPKNIKS